MKCQTQLIFWNDAQDKEPTPKLAVIDLVTTEYE